jgi:8-oxo-dGTP pyrophosphatase MutT (NUDIX family)
MRQIGTRIVESGLVLKEPIKQRKTVRAIILNNEKQLLMVYSRLFDDYTFPGGGMKPDETEIDALKRELKEELGADEIIDIKEYGLTEELRYGIKGSDQVYLQTSYYYLCQIASLSNQALVEREILHGLEPKWVSINEAIYQNQSVMKNELHQQKGLKTVLIRENQVLNHLTEKINYEKI